MREYARATTPPTVQHMTTNRSKAETGGMSPKPA